MATQAALRTSERQNDAVVTAADAPTLLDSTSLTSGVIKPAAAANDSVMVQGPTPTIQTIQVNQPAANTPVMHERPLHSYTQSTLAPTSEFTRYVLLALPARYLFRSIFESAFHNENAYSWLQNPINKWIDKHKTNKLVAKIDAVLAEHPLPADIARKVGNARHREDGVEQVRDYLETHEEGKKLFSKVTAILDKNGTLGKHANDHSILPYALTRTDSNNVLEPRITTRSRVQLRNAIRSNIGHIGYGMSLGVGAVALSVSYSYNVYKDMQHLFSETVGYEVGKKPEDVTMFDIFKSDNRIINATTHNFWSKLAERVGLSLPFFLVGKALPIGLADFTVGLTGARLLHETWNRKPTMFEDLVSFVNQKINPQNGLGQPITVSDVLDIYQHYCYYNQPKKGFHTVISTNNEEARSWSESQMLFARIAELMNQSYAYKHTAQYDANGNVLKLADLPLPKFIYLLGHGLIDAKDPAKSLVYVEIANKEGIEGVKKAQAEFESGATVETVCQGHQLPPSPIATMRNHFTPKAAPAPTAPDSYVPKPTKPPEAHIAAVSMQHDGAVADAARTITS